MSLNSPLEAAIAFHRHCYLLCIISSQFKKILKTNLFIKFNKITNNMEKR